LNKHGNGEIINSIPIDPPIMSISINVNNSPLSGKEGAKMAKSDLKKRLI